MKMKIILKRKIFFHIELHIQKKYLKGISRNIIQTNIIATETTATMN